MSNSQKDQLFTLIKILSKAEKRNFKLYANRFQSGVDTKFIQLFDVLDKLGEYDEQQILRKLPSVKKRHLANLKRHLYKQILISLRLIHINKNIDIQIREQLDFARILYSKGLYMQSLKLLDRIKQIAEEHHQDILHLEILNFEKFIESRHITRSRSEEGHMETLLEESSKRSHVAYRTSLLSNLNIQIQGWYIQHGHATTEEACRKVQDYFDTLFPGTTEHELTFFEKANLHQARMWLHYICLDFSGALGEAREWVNLFDDHPQMQEKDPDLYMRGLYYLLVFFFLLRERDLFRRYLQQFEDFVSASQEHFNPNSRMIAFVYLYLSKLNHLFLCGQFKTGLKLIPEILRQLSTYEAHTDQHRILLFYYKIAYLHFGLGEFESAIQYLNRIILLKTGYLREDIHINASLLHLICHYELGNLDTVEYLLPAVSRAFEKAKDLGDIQRATLRFLRELTKTAPTASRAAFLRFRDKLDRLAEAPYETKATLYLDIPLWVKSHLQQCRIQDLFGNKIFTK